MLAYLARQGQFFNYQGLLTGVVWESSLASSAMS